MNPNKYTVKDDTVEVKVDDVHNMSLNDSIEDEEDISKKKNKKKNQAPKATPTPTIELDPVELMPNLKIGYKEK